VSFKEKEASLKLNPSDTLFLKQTITVKAAVLQMLKNIKNKTILKLTVNTGQYMFNGEIYYYRPLNSVDVTNAVAVMYSRNIPIAEK